MSEPGQKGGPFPLRLLAAFLLAVIAFVPACGPSAADLWTGHVRRANPVGFVPVDLSAPPFRLAGLLKGQASQASEDLVVYIEGDGRAIVRGRPSSDPSPQVAQGLSLALLDPAPAVLYLSRVGQFMPAYAQPGYQEYWSDKRLAPEVVSASASAIDSVARSLGAKRLHLVGYSGGGGLAVLLARVRPDVVSLVTVAGLLDTDWWVAERGYRPMSGSLNPASGARELAFVPQVHFFGRQDRVIPPEMSERYSGSAAFQKLIRVGLDTDHYSNWTRLWPELLRAYVIPLRDEAGFAR